MQNDSAWVYGPTGLPMENAGVHTEPTVVMRPVSAVPSRRRRILIRCLIVVGILVLVPVLSGIFFWIEPTALGIASMPFLPAQAGTVPWNGSDPINILAMGIDQRTNEVTRSDVMMVINIDPGGKRVRMVSIPRDLAVDVPGYGQLSKINAGFQMGSPSITGGAQYAAFTVEHSLGIPVNYWAVLNFNSFTRLIDALGGVDINVDQPINDPAYPADVGNGFSPFVISAGWHHMDGATALRYVRERHAYPGEEDQARIRHQQQLLDAVKNQVVSVHTLLHLPSILSALRQTIHTDLPDNMLPTIGMMMLKDRNIEHAYLDQKSGYAQQCVGYDNGSDLCPLPSLWTEVGTLFHNQRLLDEHATVWVQNGTPDGYETSQVVDLLKASHFVVAGSGPADNGHHAHTAVIVNSAQQAAPYTARLLRQMFGARLIVRSMPNVPAQIVLLVGKDAPQIPVP